MSETVNNESEIKFSIRYNLCLNIKNCLTDNINIENKNKHFRHIKIDLTS